MINDQTSLYLEKHSLSLKYIYTTPSCMSKHFVKAAKCLTLLQGEMDRWIGEGDQMKCERMDNIYLSSPQA